MNKICLIAAALLCAAVMFGQDGLKIKVSHADTKEPLAGATIHVRQ